MVRRIQRSVLPSRAASDSIVWLRPHCPSGALSWPNRGLGLGSLSRLRTDRVALTKPMASALPSWLLWVCPEIDIELPRCEVTLVMSRSTICTIAQIDQCLRATGSWRESSHARKPADVGKSLWNVTRLHRQISTFRLSSHRRLNCRNELQQFNRSVISNIVDDVRPLNR